MGKGSQNICEEKLKHIIESMSVEIKCNLSVLIYVYKLICTEKNL